MTVRVMVGFAYDASGRAATRTVGRLRSGFRMRVCRVRRRVMVRMCTRGSLMVGCCQLRRVAANGGSGAGRNIPIKFEPWLDPPASAPYRLP
jgi:hypothetical protein